MSSTVFLFGLGALVAVKLAAKIGVNASHFDGLPKPSQID